jgi:hypothetical protein
VDDVELVAVVDRVDDRSDGVLGFGLGVALFFEDVVK